MIEKTKDMEQYYYSDFAEISYDASYGYISYIWKTPPTPDEFKLGCEKLLLAIQHFKCGKAMVDTRQMGAIQDEVLEWMTSDWMVRAAANGYESVAVIVPIDIFASLAVNEIIDRVNDRVVHHNFDDKEEALDWIRKQ